MKNLLIIKTCKELPLIENKIAPQINKKAVANGEFIHFCNQTFTSFKGAFSVLDSSMNPLVVVVDETVNPLLDNTKVYEYLRTHKINIKYIDHSLPFLLIEYGFFFKKMNTLFFFKNMTNPCDEIIQLKKRIVEANGVIYHYRDDEELETLISNALSKTIVIENKKQLNTYEYKKEFILQELENLNLKYENYDLYTYSVTEQETKSLDKADVLQTLRRPNLIVNATISRTNLENVYAYLITNFKKEGHEIIPIFGYVGKTKQSYRMQLLSLAYECKKLMTKVGKLKFGQYYSFDGLNGFDEINNEDLFYQIKNTLKLIDKYSNETVGKEPKVYYIFLKNADYQLNRLFNEFFREITAKHFSLINNDGEYNTFNICIADAMRSNFINRVIRCEEDYQGIELSERVKNAMIEKGNDSANYLEILFKSVVITTKKEDEQIKFLKEKNHYQYNDARSFFFVNFIKGASSDRYELRIDLFKRSLNRYENSNYLFTVMQMVAYSENGLPLSLLLDEKDYLNVLAFINSMPELFLISCDVIDIYNPRLKEHIALMDENKAVLNHLMSLLDQKYKETKNPIFEQYLSEFYCNYKKDQIVTYFASNKDVVFYENIIRKNIYQPGSFRKIKQDALTYLLENRNDEVVKATPLKVFHQELNTYSTEVENKNYYLAKAAEIILEGNDYVQLANSIRAKEHMLDQDYRILCDIYELIVYYEYQKDYGLKDSTIDEIKEYYESHHETSLSTLMANVDYFAKYYDDLSKDIRFNYTKVKVANEFQVQLAYTFFLDIIKNKKADQSGLRSIVKKIYDMNNRFFQTVPKSEAHSYYHYLKCIAPLCEYVQVKEIFEPILKLLDSKVLTEKQENKMKFNCYYIYYLATKNESFDKDVYYKKYLDATSEIMMYFDQPNYEKYLSSLVVITKYAIERKDVSTLKQISFILNQTIRLFIDKEAIVLKVVKLEEVIYHFFNGMDLVFDFDPSNKEDSGIFLSLLTSNVVDQIYTKQKVDGYLGEIFTFTLKNIKDFLRFRDLFVQYEEISQLFYAYYDRNHELERSFMEDNRDDLIGNVLLRASEIILLPNVKAKSLLLYMLSTIKNYNVKNYMDPNMYRRIELNYTNALKQLNINRK